MSFISYRSAGAKLAKALNLPKDCMSFEISFAPDAIAILSIKVPITEENVDAIAQIVENEKIMVGGEVALYGRLFQDKGGTIASDFVSEDDLSDFSEEHY